jgi:hypothetical protein
VLISVSEHQNHESVNLLLLVPPSVNMRSVAQLTTGKAVRHAVRCTVLLNRMEDLTASYTTLNTALQYSDGTDHEAGWAVVMASYV